MDEIYRSLELGANQIRLLILHPGKYEDKLNADLRVASLASKGKSVEYDALSYVWGKNSSEPDPPQLNLGDAELEITPNLDQALRNLRDEHQSRTFWVDAVCINQKNINERNQQVAMMRTIYEKAMRVVVWLGPATEHMAAVISFFERIQKSSWNVHWRESFILPFSPPGTAFAAIHAFLDSPWWKRTWTFQEAAVARDILLRIGNVSLQWNLLESTIESYRSHKDIQRCCCGVRGMQELFGPMQNLEEIAEYRKNRSRLDVLDFISWNRHRDATDPRDKIIGFVGLGSPGMFDMALLDYELPADRIYRRWTIHLINQMQNLNIFSHILQPDHESASQWAATSAAAKGIDLPSWVPDWVQTPDYETVDIVQYQIRLLERFNAAERTRPYLSVDDMDDPKEITLSGTLVDKVAFVLDPAGQPLEDRVPTIFDWRRDTGVDEDPSRPYVPRVGGTIFDAFWGAIFPGAETIMSNFRLPLPLKPSMSDRLLHDQWWWTRVKHQYEFQYGDNPPHSTSYTTLGGGPGIIEVSISRFTAGKRMFVTEQGYFGLAPEAAVEGDQVVVLLGGRMPLVIRQAEAESPELRKFKLVGTCNVHGLMDGEAIEMVEDGDLQLEDFTLI
ncbi:heterokaryon incompatibility protein-domain-containing protein [Hypomontagnella monticulosa]|nr:heterokaryon incompatibility protein-domain-containing protein [Hypomontagnella monticulosa]